MLAHASVWRVRVWALSATLRAIHLVEPDCTLHPAKKKLTKKLQAPELAAAPAGFSAPVSKHPL